MHEQNVPLNQPITSASRPAPQPLATPAAPVAPKRSYTLKTLCLVSGVTAFVTAALFIGAYYLFLNPKDGDNEGARVNYDSTVVDGEADEDIAKQQDKAIADAKTPADILNATLDKAMYYIMIEDYDTAFSTLDTIDISSLSDFDQYRVYNHYQSAYSGKGDTDNAEKYRTLAEEAQTRDFSK